MIFKVIYFAFLMQIVTAAVPSNVKTCRRSLPNVEECYKSALQQLAPYLKTGIIAPGIKIDPPIEPLRLGDIVAGEGFKLVLKDFKLNNASNYIVEKMSVDIAGKNFKANALLTIPKCWAASNYELEWKLGILNIKGKGKSMSLFENMKVLIQLTGARYPINNVDFLKTSNVKVKVQINGIKLRFDNLFNGNKALEDAANELINQNSQIVVKTAVPKFERKIEVITLRASNQFFSKVPADEVFPL